MTLQVSFFKDRQKFAAAHFTVFTDGEVERLHGHNYTVAVDFFSDQLDMGLTAPFHLLKKVIAATCEQWDEVVLLPTQCPWGKVIKEGPQVNFHLETPQVKKFYSFPAEDVVLLDCDNISCENLVKQFTDRLLKEMKQTEGVPTLKALQVTIGESSGQTVSLSLPLTD